ncbi:MAG: 50S ribosomal protein L23 [Phycisphaerales bacterium]|jgi:large subunit ribosomal protein L23|nr:50S ribosomal protein L23 [Phycisphaerales bacterium]
MANPSQYYDLVRRPVVTEKSTSMQAMRNQFTFEVAPDANKIEVKKAIETLFAVKVLRVNMVSMQGKQKRTFGRPGSSKPWKKAVVTLKKGDSIDVS